MAPPLIRCFWYDDDGKPTDKHGTGCWRDDCRFVHPHDPLWSSAVKSYRTPKDNAAGDDRSFARGRSPSRVSDRRGSVRQRSSSFNRDYPPRRYHSPTPYEDRHRSPPPRRDSGSRLQHSPARSTNSISSRHSFRDIPSDNRSSVHPASSSTSNMARGESSSGSDYPLHPLLAPPTSAAESGSRPASSARKPAPIPPTQPAPIIPPPPLPELSSAKPPFKEEKQLTPEEKRTAWVGRIKLIVDCVNARIEHMKRENDVRRFQRLFESRRYSRVAEEDRVRLEAELAATKAQCDEKKKDLNLCVTRLLDCDFWPVLPRGDGTKAVDEKFQDLAKEVRELKATAAQLDDNLRILLAKQSVPPLTSAQPHPKPPERMDVDDESSSRPTKRRRLSSEPEPTREATVSAEERDMIKDEIDALQHRIADLENNETQHTATLLEEFDSLIDSKIEEANSSFLGGNSLPGPISSSIASQYSSKLEEVEANLARTGGDVDYIVKEVAGLITDTDALKRENQRLREDNEKWKTKFTELEEKQLRSEALLEQHKNEIAALNTAVKDQLARISARPPPVPPPSLDSIVEAVREPIIQAVQESVQPQLDQLRATIEKMLQDHSDQLCQAVWSKLHAVLRMVEHVKRWVEQVGDDPMVTKGPPILNGH